jgi:hypothetical protein
VLSEQDIVIGTIIISAKASESGASSVRFMVYSSLFWVPSVKYTLVHLAALLLMRVCSVAGLVSILSTQSTIKRSLRGEGVTTR